MTLRELHLFAGIGGGILGGLLLGHRCCGAVEIDPYCRRVLEARQRDGSLPEFPIHDDIRTFDGASWRGRVDVVCGGFPCQPWSSAGKRLGTSDPRHLWPAMARVVAECRPRFVFAENVSVAAFRAPWRDLRGLGYRVPPALCLSAGDLGAPYQRKRWWLLAADADRDGQPVEPIDAQVARTCSPSHADGAGLAQWQGERGDARPQLTSFDGATWRAPAPRLMRLVSRTANRLDARHRIRAAGNAQVPQVAAAAFRELSLRMGGV